LGFHYQGNLNVKQIGEYLIWQKLEIYLVLSVLVDR
jgi:hypothetical protein